MKTATIDSDLLSGQLSAVSEVAENRTGKKPSPATVWRWCKKGLRGGKIKLLAVFGCGYWQTTPEAFDAFLQAQTDAVHSDVNRNGGVTDEQLQGAGLL